MKKEKINCLFCDIIKKKTSYIISENENAIAILDAFPITPGHVLIITKKHFSDIRKINKKSWINIFPLLKETIAKLEKKLNVHDFNIITNVGKLAFQSIFHLHVHVIPKYNKEEGFLWNIKKAKKQDKTKEIFNSLF